MPAKKRQRPHRQPKVFTSEFALPFDLAGVAAGTPGYGSTRLAPWRHPSDADKWETIESDIRRVYAWRRQK